MFKKQELVKMWSNDQKRRDFVQGYKAWGVWFAQPELNLTFYKYDLPNGVRLIAMEYLREPFQSETDGNGGAITCCKHYLQRGAYFCPSAASDYETADHLKALKEKLAKELKENEIQDH